MNRIPLHFDTAAKETGNERHYAEPTEGEEEEMPRSSNGAVLHRDADGNFVDSEGTVYASYIIHELEDDRMVVVSRRYFVLGFLGLVCLC